METRDKFINYKHKHASDSTKRHYCRHTVNILVLYYAAKEISIGKYLLRFYFYSM